MHIVIVTAYYPTEKQIFSGTFVREQVKALSRRHKVTVIHPEPKPTRDFFVPDPPPKTDDTWLVYRPRYIEPFRNWFLMLLSYIGCVFACSQKIDWATVDIVHAHVSYPSGFAATLLARYYKKPVVVTEHTGRFKSWIQAWHRRVVVHWTMKQAQRVMVVSRVLQQRIEQEGIVANFAVVPNIVNVEVFHPAPQIPPMSSDVFRLIWVGGTTEAYIANKGAPELLQAIAQAIPRMRKQLRLSLVVSDEARAMCETLALRLGIFEHCTFLRTLTNLEIRDQMQQHDALVMASYSESFGVVLIEAMACGKPVIATRCGGPSEIVTPETGLLVPPGDIDALADAIVQMSETVHTYAAERIAAYAHHHFGPDAVVPSLLRVYECASSSFRR